MALLKPGKKRTRPVTKDWLAFRRAWIKNHPPDYRGYYSCGICGNPVSAKAMQLDHIQKRGSHPELRFDENNVRPTHPTCNYAR